jgi:hypothetical protein
MKFIILPYSEVPRNATFRFDEEWWIKSCTGIASFQTNPDGTTMALSRIKFFDARALVGIKIKK